MRGRMRRHVPIPSFPCRHLSWFEKPVLFFFHPPARRMAKSSTMSPSRSLIIAHRPAPSLDITLSKLSYLVPQAGPPILSVPVPRRRTAPDKKPPQDSDLQECSPQKSVFSHTPTFLFLSHCPLFFERCAPRKEGAQKYQGFWQVGCVE